MRLTRIICIAAAALSLASCGTSTTAPTSAGTTPTPAATSTAATVTATVDKVVLTGQRAFGVAELWYTTGAQLVDVQVKRGRITGATATKVRGWNTEATKLLVAGHATASAAEQARSAARLFQLGDLLRTLL